MNKKLKWWFVSLFIIGLGVGLYFLLKNTSTPSTDCNKVPCQSEETCNKTTGKCERSSTDCNKVPCQSEETCNKTTGKCEQKNLKYYCSENVKTHLKECSTNPSTKHLAGPYPDNTCGNLCDNDCPCFDGAVCSDNKCVSCSDNKITIKNARNETMWSFSYNGNRIVDGLWYYNHSPDDIFFVVDITGAQKWKVKPNKNEFDLDQGNGLIWKNFKLTSNNIYKSSYPFLYNVRKTGTMTLLPTTCK